MNRFSTEDLRREVERRDARDAASACRDEMVANLGKHAEAPASPRSPFPAPSCARPFLSEHIELHNVDDVMQFQPWERDQQEAGTRVREALTAALKTILREVPAGAFRSVAVRNILDARMNANAAISFRGRF